MSRCARYLLFRLCLGLGVPIRCITDTVIGGGEAKGICGSGLIDAIAVGLEMGLLNKRGRIQNNDHIFHLTEDIYLTQDDIRQVQLANSDCVRDYQVMAECMLFQNSFRLGAKMMLAAMEN